MTEPIGMTPVHMEIPVEDTERAKKFYAGMFGWKIVGFPGFDYHEIHVSGQSSDKRPLVTGGMRKRKFPGEGILNYMVVPKIQDYAARVEKLGGKMVMPVTPVPTMGYFAICQDTEQNTFALWENNNEAK